MAEFTELRKIFAQILLDLKLKEEETAVILTMLQTEEQMERMVNYIEEHNEATESELLEKATRIAGLV